MPMQGGRYFLTGFRFSMNLRSIRRPMPPSTMVRGSAAVRLDAGRSAVLAESEPELQRQVAAMLKQVRSPRKRASPASLSGYIANHSHHMH